MSWVLSEVMSDSDSAQRSKMSFSLNFPLQSIGAVVSSQNFCVGVASQGVSSHLWTIMFHQSVLKSLAIKYEIWWRSDNVDRSYPHFLCVGECRTFDARTAHSFNMLRLSKFTWIWSVFQEQLMEMKITQKMSHFLFPEGTVPSFYDYFHINMFRDSWHTYKVWSWSKNRCLRNNHFCFSYCKLTKAQPFRAMPWSQNMMKTHHLSSF